MTTPAPGWYPDPYGQAQMRYWDGSLWTGHISGAAPAAPATPAAPAVAPVAGAPVLGQAPAGPALGTAPALGGAGGPQQFNRGFTGTRTSSRRPLFIFLGGFAVVVIGAVLAISLLGRGDPARDCPADRVCSEPPTGEPLVNLSVFRSEELGFQFEYDEEDWKIAEEDGNGAILDHTVLDARIIVEGAPAGEVSPEEAYDELLGQLRGNLVGLTEDTDPADQVYGPSLGYVDGVGDSFSAGVDTPQGVVEVSLVVMAAEDADVTAAVAVITGEQRSDDPSQPDRKDATYSRADSVLNTFSFSSAEAGT